MPDIAAIAAALNSVKLATDIVSFLRESDVSLEKAEMKMKLADLVSALADTKLQLVDVQEALQERDRRIAELQDAFESKDQLVRNQDAYYAIGPDGKPIGNPFCLRCWENDHKQRQLVHDAGDHRRRACTACGRKYEGWAASEIKPANDGA